MDPICHTLVGASLSESGLKDRSTYAAAALILGANLPDLDAVASLLGAPEHQHIRRGWTHGVLAWFVLPALLVGALWLWHRWRGQGRAPPNVRVLLVLSFAAVLSHPFLDFLNNYGIRWLMPFDGRWFYGDTLFIIDPWMWLILGAGIAFSRLRRRRKRDDAVVPARLGLYAAGFYVAFMMVVSMWADGALVRLAREEGVVAQRFMAGPTPVNPFVRQVILDEGHQYRVGRLSLLPAPRLVLDSVVERAPAHPAAVYAVGHPQVEMFLGWSRFPYFVVDEGSAGLTVRVGDLRYTRTAEGWASVSISSE